VGYQCKQSCLAATQYFIRVLDGITSDPRLIAKAHICAAMPHADIGAWANGKSTPTEKQFYTVGYHYNEAAKLGFGKCAALLHFMQVWYPRRQEIKSSHLWTAMWAVFEERVVEMDAERRKVGEKLAKRPNRYVCAAQACGIVANTGKVLLRCSGKCSNDYKPYYCSKECQRKDWKVHKPYCAPNKPPPPTTLHDHHPGKAQEGIRSISIPHPSGQGTMQISSSSFDVDDLKRIQRVNAEKK